MTRFLGSLLAFSLAWGADNPAALDIRVTEGEAAVYATGSRATRGVTVLVTGEDGQPAAGVTVTFTLPQEGPGGMFASGTRTEIATTRADGLATAWGMQWNRTPGVFEMRITAVKGPARAAVVSQQSLREGPGISRTAGKNGGASHKLLWVALALGGAAAAGVAGLSIGKTTTSPQAATSAVGVSQIGAPTIILGHP
jgi:hypothetical protein